MHSTKRTLIKITLILVCNFFHCNFALTQPGPQYFGIHYNFTLLDENGTVVDFTKSTDYEIFIDGLKRTVDTTITVNHMLHSQIVLGSTITVNDKTYQIANDKVHQGSFTLKIAHRKDTMYLNQTATNKKLTFLPGYFYFPFWSSALFSEPVFVEGSVTIKNIDQAYFLVSPEAFSNSTLTSESARALDEIITDRFIKKHFEISQIVEPTKTNIVFDGYKPTQFISLYRTNGENEYIGKVEYDMSEMNYSRLNSAVAILNPKENTLAFKTPKENMDQFYTMDFFVDSFNQVYYQAVGHRESFSDPNCKYHSDGACAYTKEVLRSVDNGNSWTIDPELTAIFNRFDYFKLNFLDKQHATVAIRHDPYVNNKGRYRQAIYFLLKNNEIIDSLKSEQYWTTATDFQNLGIQIHPDSVVLGFWSIDNKNPNQYTYSSVLAVKDQKDWLLKKVPYDYRYSTARNIQKPAVATSKSFTIENENKLKFEFGAICFPQAGQLYSQPNNNNKNFILEFGNYIFVIDVHTKTTWITADDGRNWYFYPRSLDNFRCQFPFIEMLDDTLSIFNSDSLQKTYYRFVPLK